jgi:hypothetical protein
MSKYNLPDPVALSKTADTAARERKRLERMKHDQWLIEEVTAFQRDITRAAERLANGEDGFLYRTGYRRNSCGNYPVIPNERFWAAVSKTLPPGYAIIGGGITHPFMTTRAHLVVRNTGRPLRTFWQWLWGLFQ